MSQQRIQLEAQLAEQ
ncbi:hypothetical protein AZE42_05209, partial [Rhizopogon vesiculosus]